MILFAHNEGPDQTARAQSDLGLRCPHTPGDMFSHDTAYLFSFSGRFTMPAFSAYSMSKRACIAFSDALRQEMLKFNVKVITIEPALYK